MVFYNLKHLTQPEDQAVIGHIQDDEALVLFALIKCMRLKTVLEIGGGTGYSAYNFIKAVGNEGTVYTVDVNPIRPISSNHVCIHKNAEHITKEDLNNQKIDLILFDCHDGIQMIIQMIVYERLKTEGLITDSTILALHDTNLHYRDMYTHIPLDVPKIHQPVERYMVNMVNIFKDLGYDIICYHTESHQHDDDMFPFRHGLTVCKKFSRLR